MDKVYKLLELIGFKLEKSKKFKNGSYHYKNTVIILDSNEMVHIIIDSNEEVHMNDTDLNMVDTLDLILYLEDKFKSELRKHKIENLL